MSATTENWSDPVNYRNLSEPFKSPDAANDAVSEFVKELRELRNKHHIADVHVILRLQVQYEDGKEGTVHTNLHMGMPIYAEGMTAWAIGRAQAERQQDIAEYIAMTKAVFTPTTTRKRDQS